MQSKEDEEAEEGVLHLGIQGGAVGVKVKKHLARGKGIALRNDDNILFQFRTPKQMINGNFFFLSFPS